MAKKTTSTSSTAKTKAAAVAKPKATSRTTTSKASTSKTGTKATAAVNFGKLKMANWLLAGLLILEAIGVVILGSGKSVPVTSQYPVVDPLATTANGHQVVAMATRHLFDLSLPALAAVFLLLFAIFHLAAATQLRRKYEAQVTSGISYFRWVGLGIGGGLMAVTVALLTGLSALNLLLVFFVATLIGCMVVPAVERLHLERKDLLPDVVCAGATIATLLPWAAIALAVVDALLYDGHVTVALWAVYGSMAVFYALLVWISHQRIKRRGRWADWLFSERMYMVLVFVGASALAWQTLSAG